MLGQKRKLSGVEWTRHTRNAPGVHQNTNRFGWGKDWPRKETPEVSKDIPRKPSHQEIFIDNSFRQEKDIRRLIKSLKVKDEQIRSLFKVVKLHEEKLQEYISGDTSRANELETVRRLLRDEREQKI